MNGWLIAGGVVVIVGFLALAAVAYVLEPIMRDTQDEWREDPGEGTDD